MTPTEVFIRRVEILTGAKLALVHSALARKQSLQGAAGNGNKMFQSTAGWGAATKR